MKIKIIDVVLWVLQVLLAVAFLAHGLMFLNPPAEYVSLMDASMARSLRYFIGVMEVAAAVGLTLPGLTRIMPFLVGWAAAGIMIVMVSATVFHAARGEYGSAVTTFILLLLATFVAWMRVRVRPIAARRRMVSAPAI
jgi:putative oxidoreductase